MWVPGLFENIERSLDLTTAQQKRLDRAMRLVQSFAAVEEERGAVAAAPFIQGSMASRLLVRPSKPSQEYDVDLALPVPRHAFGRWDERSSPRGLMPYLQERLRDHYRRNTPVQQHPRISRKNRCIRINYAGDFHLDMVPMIVEQNRFWIADYNDDKFVERNNPATVTAYVADLDSRTNGHFRRSVRLLRRWRDLKLGAKTSPSSLILTVLAGTALVHRAKRGTTYKVAVHTTGREAIDTWFTDTLLAIRQYLEQYPWGILTRRLPMPGTDEDLDEHWPDEARRVFQARIESASEKAFEAVQSDCSEARTRTLWRHVLG